MKIHDVGETDEGPLIALVYVMVGLGIITLIGGCMVMIKVITSDSISVENTKNKCIILNSKTYCEER